LLEGHCHQWVLPPTCSEAGAGLIIAEIVKRIRALVTKLLPVQVELPDISDATSSIITPEVIEAFAKSAGDFSEAVPFWQGCAILFLARPLIA
jgi:hypothetical protein